ncbi:MAG: PASTA domain-containing protein [Desulfobacteraceae bacterium]|nr:MAG: PASTA domain-containing protein [Desulfobacteraceae bacterium]
MKNLFCFGKKRFVLLAGLLSIMVFNAYGEKPEAASMEKSAPLGAPVLLAKVVQPISKTILAPDLIGKTRDEAEAALIKLGLKPGSVKTTPSGQGKPGTVVRQQPATKTAMSLGASVDLWVLARPAASTASVKPAPKTATALTPTLQSKQKSLFLEFPEEIAGVAIFDANGALLQRFPSGRSFDITESLIKSKAGRIMVEFQPRSGGGVPTPVPMRGTIPSDRIPFELARYHHLADRTFTVEDTTTIDRHEPGNNVIGSAVQVTAGYYSGEVGGGDAADYCKVTSNHSGFGTLIQIEVKSGSVTLGLYDPTRVYLDANNRKIWIALRPDTTFYFQVSPTGAAAGAYRLAISKNTLTDAYEANDSFAQAKIFGAGRAFLGNVIDSTGRHIGIKDFYKFNVPEPQNLRLEVSGAGLAGGDQATLALYDANGTLVTSTTGNAAGCTLAHDLRAEWSGGSTWPPFPAGDWRVEIATPTAGAGSPKAYGTGDAPACYTQAAGYALTITVVP